MLNILRSEIDEIDEKLICLLSKRMNLVNRIGEYKKEKGIKPLDKKRWNKLLNNRIKLGNKHDLDKKFITNIWEQIHNQSLKEQK